ncbi:MAG: acetyl-CoA carboxylase carboxyl transferase subunit beta [Bacteroidetes bacterium]|nr:acetyl-CoA carboxylase carboxyl transferase subunit beta [Bacteroidota bacterium]
MPWFKRTDKGILTPTESKREVPDGLWFKSPGGKIIHTRELKNNAYVVPEEDLHVKIGSEEYKTQLKDAVRTAYGKINGLDLCVACMDFTFIGGSMGSVVGEKIARAINHSLKTRTPFLMISRSGGARMMEAGLSLMQMAKTSARLALLDEAKIPYISLLTDPTTGGVTASYAMLGDFNIAEPGALIGFAGPRVIRETIGKDLPKGFQSAEFVLEHGFLDFIIDRRSLKQRLSTLLKMLQ